MVKIEKNILDPVISIGILAEGLSVSVSTIRNYESEGLIIPHRSESGHRYYSLEDVERVRKIQHLIQEEGLNMEGIRRLQAILPCWEILPCSLQMQKKCQAFTDKTKPCWMIKDLKCSKGEVEKCRNCIVYRFGSILIEDIKSLVYKETSPESIRKKVEKAVYQLKK